MASRIDPSTIDATKPVSGSPTTQSVRDNEQATKDQFANAASDIEELQWNVRTASSAITAAAGDWIWANSSGGSFPITAPGSPTVGQVWVVADETGDFGTNAVTIDRNGENIMGLAENFDLDIANESYRFEYRGATQGWRVTV